MKSAKPATLIDWGPLLIVLLLVASCKTRSVETEAPAASDVRLLYNELVGQLALEAHLLPVEYPPVVHVPRWDVWIVDERNVEFSLDWNVMEEEDYFARNQFRLQEEPHGLKIQTTGHVSSYPSVGITVRQLPSIQKEPVLAVSVRSSARYQGVDADAAVFLQRHGKWEVAPEEVFALPAWEHFFPEGTDLQPLRERSMIAMEVKWTDSSWVQVRPLNRMLIDCEGEEEPLIQITPEEEASLCALLAQMRDTPVHYHWDARKGRFVMD